MAVRNPKLQTKKSKLPAAQKRGWIKRCETQTLQQIADEDGVGPNTVWTYLSKKGVRMRPMLRDHLEDILARRKAGATLQEIADDWGVSRQAVHIAISSGPKKGRKPNKQKRIDL